MADQLMSKEDLSAWRSKLIDKKTTLGRQLSSRLDRIERQIVIQPTAEQFSSAGNISEYLRKQKGTDPVPIAKWWRDNHEVEDERSRAVIQGSFDYLSKYAEYCRSNDQASKEPNSHMWHSETMRLLGSRENFLASFGEAGHRFMNQVESAIVLKPNHRSFKRLNHLIQDPKYSEIYESFRSKNPELASEGVRYLIDYADRERRSRDSAKLSAKLSKWKKPRMNDDSTVDSNSNSNELDLGITSIPENLGHAGEELFQRLTADASINPFSDQFRDQDTLRGFLSRPVPEEMSYVQDVDPNVTTQIQGYISDFARGQRDIQGQMIRGLSMLSEQESGQPPTDGLGLTSPQVAFGQGIAGLGSAGMSSKSRDTEHVPETISELEREPSVHDQEERVKSFEEEFGSNHTGMGRYGREYLERLQKYMGSDKFQANKFTDKDTVIGNFFSLAKWSNYYKVVNEKKPEFTEQLVDYTLELAQKRIQSDQARNDTLLADLQSSSKEQDEDNFSADLLKWSKFQADYRDTKTGLGDKGAEQLRVLRNYIIRSGSDRVKYTTEEGVRSILTQPRWHAYPKLEKTDPERAKQLLEFGSWYSRQLISDREAKSLTLSVKDIEMMESRLANQPDSQGGTSSGRKRQRQATPSSESASSTGHQMTERRTPDRASQSNFSESQRVADGLHKFDEEQMRIHRLTLFGLYPSLETEDDPAGEGASAQEQKADSEEDLNLDDYPVDRQRERIARHLLFSDVPQTPFFDD
ncbi:hypothetical protein I203_100987 [Kwoniella mangroviensis CBS 8507]|uniref:uncharacterized protein n=1 Tax=Kwoniella mangroviensis CBS 8507 TaxID=1296122 RepID=UPI003052336A